MATLADVKVDATWTKVLAEEGFAISKVPMMVAFGASAPSASISGIFIKPNTAVNIVADGLWAKNCTNIGSINVTPTTRN